jgi:phospholipid/cholesterol/gamma-HCH transport system permease protein
LENLINATGALIFAQPIQFNTLRRYQALARNVPLSSLSSRSQSRILPKSGLTGALARWVTDWGDIVVDAISSLGDMAIFAGRMFVWLFTAWPRQGTLLPNFYHVGVLSLPVVALTGTFIGMVLAVTSIGQFRTIGLESKLGAVINYSLVRELGPVLAATMLAGRVGSAMAAVLGTMRVTEQIDALISMGANPIHYLVVPRFLACILLIPALTVMADFMGIVGGYFYSVVMLDIDHYQYLNNSRKFVGGFDFFSGIFKSFFFGGTIAVVSCYRGFNCQAGAEGVGRAATAAFVFSFVLILGIDLLLNILLDAVYVAIWPQGTKLF